MSLENMHQPVNPALLAASASTPSMSYNPKDRYSEFPKSELTGNTDWEIVQCSNARIPGYSGYIPAKYAQSVFGQTSGNIANRAESLVQNKPCREESKKHVPVVLKTNPIEHFRPIPEWINSYSSKQGVMFDSKESKPLTMRIQENYSIPLVSGYSGYLPGKKPENLISGGIPYMAAEAKQIFDARAAAQPNKEKRGIWKDMYDYYDRQRQYAAGDDLWKSPNFLRRAYTNKGYKLDSAISTTRRTFNTKYGHKCEVRPHGL